MLSEILGYVMVGDCKERKEQLCGQELKPRVLKGVGIIALPQSAPYLILTNSEADNTAIVSSKELELPNTVIPKVGEALL
jgi:hypothetical protein